MPEINKNNQIVMKGKNGKTIVFDFNSYYRGYYPCCTFTAVAQRDRSIYAAGIDEVGKAHLFLSVDGTTWEERNIVSRFGLVGASAYGRIQNILFASGSELVYLVTENGYLVILPACPKCVRTLRVSEFPVREGWISGNVICFRDMQGSVTRHLQDRYVGYRCSWTFAAQHLGKDGLLLDFRQKESRRENPIPGGYPIEEQQLEAFLEHFSRGDYLFFVCERGMKADEAVCLAREKGYGRAFSLGGVGDVLLDMDGNEQ